MVFVLFCILIFCATLCFFAAANVKALPWMLPQKTAEDFFLKPLNKGFYLKDGLCHFSAARYMLHCARKISLNNNSIFRFMKDLPAFVSAFHCRFATFCFQSFFSIFYHEIAFFYRTKRFMMVKNRDFSHFYVTKGEAA